MAQSILISPSPNTVRSPVPKRFRFSLKQDKHPAQDSADYISPKKADVGLKREEDILTDSYGVQDENLSPNCKSPDVKLSSFINLEVVDRKNEVTVLGLPNCGNTCYLNSIVQVLRYTPNFLISIHSLLSLQKLLDQVSPTSSKIKEADLFLRLHTLYITMKKQEDYLYNDSEKDFSSYLLNHIESFLLSLRDVSCLFEEGEQHDAHELLLTILSMSTTFCDYLRTNVAIYYSRNQTLNSSIVSLLNGPFNELLNFHCKERRKMKKPLRRNHTRRLFADQPQTVSLTGQGIPSFALGFEGKMRRIIKCLECEKASKHEESFTNLEASIADDLIDEDSVDLCQCLDPKIILSGENKYFCDDCCHLNEAQLSFEITLLPSILLIHCSWLKQSSVITCLEKDSTKLLIPMLLKTSENPNIFHSSTDVYCLYAVVLHLGTSTENGHYVSFIRDMTEASELRKDICTNLEDCCASKGIFNMEPSATNRWLLFDDQNVTPICVSETSSIFPYYQFLGIAASPCIVFYFKM